MSKDTTGNAGSETMEGCTLVAHDTGDGWMLGVESQDGELVAMLKWPDSWPSAVSAHFLRTCGFVAG